jgi:hypothetical protein
VCGDQSGRTSAPIKPHRVQTIRQHNDRTGVSSDSQSALSTALWCGCAINKQIAAAVPAYVAERDGRERLAVLMVAACHERVRGISFLSRLFPIYFQEGPNIRTVDAPHQ